MLGRNKEKAAVLLLTAIMLALSLSDWALHVLSVNTQSHAACRLTYQFAHAGLLHALINCWCLLSVEFFRDVSWRKLLAAYIISATFPSILLSSTPIAGCSGMCFALLGMCAPSERMKYHIFMAAMLSVGFFLPSMAAWLHLYCYVVGLLVALPFYPMIGKGGAR